MRTLGAIRLAAALAAAACPLTCGIIDRIAVSVGNRVITTSDLDREIRVTAFLNGTKPDFSPAAKRATAERMVDQRLVRSELETSRYPVPAAAEVIPELERFKKKFYASDEDYRRALAADGISEDDLKAQLLWQRTLLLFIDVRFRPGVQVSAQETQDYFDKTVAPAVRAARPGQAPRLEDYRGEIEDKLAGDKVDQEVERWVQLARRRTRVDFHEEVFQ